MSEIESQGAAPVVEILEVPNAGLPALVGPVSGREGWMFDIPGHLVKQGSPLWSADDKAGLISVEGVFLTSSEERDLIRASAAAGGGMANLAQLVRTMHAVKGQKIAHLDRDMVWEALGPLGRAVYLQMYAKAYRIEDGEMLAITASFRACAS